MGVCKLWGSGLDSGYPLSRPDPMMTMTEEEKTGSRALPVLRFLRLWSPTFFFEDRRKETWGLRLLPKDFFHMAVGAEFGQGYALNSSILLPRALIRRRNRIFGPRKLDAQRGPRMLEWVAEIRCFN